MSLDEGGDTGESGGTPPRDWLVAAFLVEAAAVMIALVVPFTPSKTGSTWSPAELIWPDPSYPQKVIASFVLVNAMLLVLGLLAWIGVRLGARR